MNPILIINQLYIKNTPHIVSSTIGLGPEYYYTGLPFLVNSQTSQVISHVETPQTYLQQQNNPVKKQ